MSGEGEGSSPRVAVPAASSSCCCCRHSASSSKGTFLAQAAWRGGACGRTGSSVVGLGLGPGLGPELEPGLMDLASSLSLSLAMPTHIARTLTNSAATPPCAGCEASLLGLLGLGPGLAGCEMPAR